MDTHTALEWNRAARYVHGTFMVSLPRQLTKKWRLGRGSTLLLSLLNDGSLLVKPSKEEDDYQRRTQ